MAKQAFEALEPGGWFESQEVEGVFSCDDGTLDPAGPMCTWLNEMRDAAEIMERPAVLGSILKEVFERVGFVDVQDRIFKIPTNEWPRDERLKEIGRLWGENFSQGLNGFSIQLMNRVFGRSPAEIEVSPEYLFSHVVDAWGVEGGRRRTPGDNLPPVSDWLSYGLLTCFFPLLEAPIGENKGGAV